MTEKQLLHGKLSIEIRSAKNIPNFDNIVSFFDWNNQTDAYVQVTLGHDELIKTDCATDTNNPEWNQSYLLNVCHFASELKFIVWDEDALCSEFIGTTDFCTRELQDENSKDDWYDIIGEDGVTVNGQINLCVQYTAYKDQKTPSYEIESYFSAHENCFVTPYQDAHVPEGMCQFSDALVQPRSCWKDLHTTIMEAQDLICIAGWSVDVNVQLLRGDDLEIDNRTIGEILIDKADQGVSVNILCWDDPDILRGSLGARNELTNKYFRCTKVRVIESRPGRDKSTVGPFTHHQKFILCDSECENGKRIVGYIGGLDITNGRWDTPNHELFSTLKNEHKDDFYNNFVPDAKKDEGPRQPWHDIHLKVEGPITRDLFRNFWDRWSYDIEHQKIDAEWELNPSLELLSKTQAFTNEDIEKEWNCQLFRSICSLSTKFDKCESQTLLHKDGKLVDNSIANAHINAIRNATNFIYVETQYFAGSANDWLENNDVICYNIIPMEITQKIVSKIRSGEHFTAYIVLPMFPEGDPLVPKSSMQEQLMWQSRTVDMMYHEIASALQKEGNESVPTDWLLFLTLAKREADGDHLDDLDPPSSEMACKLRETRRHPIYVHSKMLITDDVYLLAGTPNMHQRSLDGARDAEISLGCWQPNVSPQNATGDVHNFRMSLWLEHFKMYDPIFKTPGMMECVRKVKEIIQENWIQFTGPIGSVSQGHMLPYPITVSDTGKVFAMNAIVSDPTTQLLSDRLFGARHKRGKLFGSFTGYDPNILTT
jgi:phospholipase D1/2